MTIRVTGLWRHPIKGIGAEALETATLVAGRPLPGDRAWALLTGNNVDTGAWQPCSRFARGCYGPELMAITAESSGDTVHLSHPVAGRIAIAPAQDGQRLVEWLTPLWPSERPALGQLIAAPEEGMSDANYACLSILNTASLAALSEACGQTLDPRRFRGNLWIEGPPPFAELDWVGRRLRIGKAELDVVERIDRCRATQVNPDTGKEDCETLRTLRKVWGHIDFGIKARVVTGGEVSAGAQVELL